MLRKLSLLLVTLVLAASSANASPFLFVDSAPNVYGSPNWAPWWAATKTDIIAGSFTNLRSATFPGTNTISPYDEIVYSTTEDLNIELGSGDNELTIESTHGATQATNISMGQGDDVVNVESISGPTRVDTGLGDDLVRVGSDSGAINRRSKKGWRLAADTV